MRFLIAAAATLSLGASLSCNGVERALVGSEVPLPRGFFSVYGRHLILNEEPARLAHMARYAVRPPVAMDRVHQSDDGRVLLDIPPNHRTGATVLSLDPLEWLRRTTNQIPGKGTHLVRYFGAYANRLRKLYRGLSGDVPEVRAESAPPLPQSRASWARLLRKVMEVDPLCCARCGAEMKVIAVIASVSA